MKKKLSAPVIKRHKNTETPLVCLTAYTAPVAKALDSHCDFILVGDSLAMVIYGHTNTLNVDLDIMIRHGKAVVDAAPSTHICVDLPFGSYQESEAQAFRGAARVLAETGCDSVKLEGGREMADTIAFLSQRGVPVVAHIGLTPQAVNSLGGYGAQGKSDAARAKIIDDARAVTKAGAIACVVEGVIADLAGEITRLIDIPVIGIGASAACDGQILVCDDMLGLNTGHVPKFVKQYGTLAEDIDKAVAAYAAEVRCRAFPAESNLYHVKKPAA